MDILKPDHLSLTSQPLDWQGNMHSALTIGFGFSLVDGAPMLASEAWGAAMQGLASGFCVDTGVPKKQAEWLLSGSVCAPQVSAAQKAQPVRGLVASCVVGSHSRQWLASGEHNGNDRMPFTEMPLIWTNTWGGSAFPDNPVGCGVEPDAKGVVRAPTITETDTTSRRATCPGPMGAWPCRMQTMGTYDAQWLQQRWPGVPDDFDWSFFNLAQPAQRIPEGLQGGERLELTNLHPTASTLKLNAPLHQIRVEILRLGETEWRELAATRDTLWLFPGQLTGLYLWHALTPCQDEAASDIAAVRLTLTPEIGAEAPPLPELDSARAVAVAGAEKMAEGAGSNLVLGGVVAAVVGLGATVVGAGSPSKAVEAKPETALPPPPQHRATETVSPPADVPEPATPTAYMATVQVNALADLDASMDEINAGLREAGAPPLTPEQIQETRERIVAATAAVSAILEKPNPELNTVLRQAGLSEERIAAVNTVLDMDMPFPDDHASAASWNAATEAYVGQFAALMQPDEKVLDTLRKGFAFSGPDGQAAVAQALEDVTGPQPSTEAILARTDINPQLLQSELDKLDQEILPGLDDMAGLTARAAALERALGLPPDSMTSRINQFTSFMNDHKLLPPQITPLPVAQATPEPVAEAPEPPAPLQQPAPQQQADRAVAPPKPPQNRADVLALLAGDTAFVGITLAGLDLADVDFSGKDLQGAVLDNANLTGANFSGANATGASFAAADLNGADFTGAILTGASLAGVEAVDASFTGASLAGANLVGSNLHGANFGQADMTGVDATGSVLDRVSFESTDLSGGTFVKASFNRADFHAANAKRANFSGADMTNAALGFGTSVAGADFSGACLKGGAWENVAAQGGTFTGVTADNATFEGCDFSNASWKAAQGREANFSRAILDNTDLRGADLFKASLRETYAETANLSGANLYNADLYRLRTSPLTKLDGADIKATILDACKKGLG